jgi:hypothetical protein
MKNIKRAVQALVFGACAMAVTPSALAEAQRGFYLGLSAGQSTFDLEQSEFDGVIRDVMADFGIPILSRSSTFEDSDTSIAIIAGYRFLPYIALEASYLDLGSAEYRFSGTINPPGPVASEPISFAFDTETKGLTIGAIGSIPLGHVVDLHGSLGFFIADTDLTFTGAAGSETSSESESLDSEGLFMGLGLGFHIGEHVSLSLDWTRYDSVGDEDSYGDYDDEDYDDEEGGFDVDRLSFSATFRF